jgi:uncharacterized protein with ParB-like and HNH nuclease domain
MEASPTKVIQYFNGEKQHLIPLFQRPYTWKESNWQSLWDDLMVQYDLGESSTHFMGAIVSVPAYSVPVGVNKHLIIDGQQRLTTVSLILCALRDCLDQNSAARIQEVYLTNRFRELEDTLKFVPTQADRDVYREIALDRQIPNNDSLMVKAYHFFKDRLNTDIDANDKLVIPAKVLTTLEHCLQVVMINLGNDDDPYLIFESLNCKGQALTQADTELGENAKEIHNNLINTFGNLTLTAYNAELGNLPFADKKAKLENTHIELTRWILQQEHWRAAEIETRARYLLRKAKQMWVAPAEIFK